MSALHKHIDQQQSTAVILADVIEAITILTSEELGEGARVSLLVVAGKLANELVDNLDSTALPKGGAA